MVAVQALLLLETSKSRLLLIYIRTSLTGIVFKKLLKVSAASLILMADIYKEAAHSKGPIELVARFSLGAFLGLIIKPQYR